MVDQWDGGYEMGQRISKRVLAAAKPRETVYYLNDSAVKGFQARVNVDGSMTFCVLYRLADGRRRRYTIGPASVFSPEQARDMAVEFIAQAKRGEDPQESKRRARECTFREFVETEYGPWAKAHNKTGAALVNVLLKSFPELDGKKLSEVSGWLIEKARKRFHEDGLKPASVNRYCTYLRSCLSKAVEWELYPRASHEAHQENPRGHLPHTLPVR